MIKIWNWFKAIGSFVRKIKEKTQVPICLFKVPNCLIEVPNYPGADLLGTEMSRTGAEVSWYRFVPVPKCLAFHTSAAKS